MYEPETTLNDTDESVWVGSQISALDKQIQRPEREQSPDPVTCPVCESELDLPDEPAGVELECSNCLATLCFDGGDSP